MTCYVDKLTKRRGGYEVSIWRKVKVYIQNLKNKNNWDTDIIKPLKTQLQKSYINEDLIHLGILKSTPGKFFSKSAVCVVWGPCSHTAWNVSKYEVFSTPYFPVFGLHTGKYGPEKTPYLDTFHAVFHLKWNSYVFLLIVNNALRFDHKIR